MRRAEAVGAECGAGRRLARQSASAPERAGAADGVIVRASRSAALIHYVAPVSGDARLGLLPAYFDAVPSQAAVELKPGDPQECGRARLVATRALERVDDGLALEILESPGRGGQRRRLRRRR